MTVYILTIVTLSIALTILEIMQTESAISKFTRGMFSLFLLAAIIAPLPKIFASIKDGSIFSNIKNANTSSNDTLGIDKSYVTKINITRADMIKNAIITSLSAKGLTNFEVEVNIDLNGVEFKIYSVIVTNNNKGKLTAANKNIITNIVKEITSLQEQFIVVVN